MITHAFVRFAAATSPRASASRSWSGMLPSATPAGGTEMTAHGGGVAHVDACSWYSARRWPSLVHCGSLRRTHFAGSVVVPGKRIEPTNGRGRLVRSPRAFVCSMRLPSLSLISGAARSLSFWAAFFSSIAQPEALVDLTRSSFRTEPHS